MIQNNKAKIFAGVVIVAAVAACFITLNHHESDANSQSTDDAYVGADMTVLAPRIAGTVDKVNVDDNQPVKAGQVLVTLDNRDRKVALDSAVADVDSAKAMIASIQAQIARQSSLEKEARASLSADDASLGLASANQRRYANLAQDGAGSQLASQQADTELKVRQSNHRRSQANVDAVTQQTAILKAELLKAQAALEHSEAGKEAAELNLSYTTIKAPGDGIVAQKTARAGGYVNPGTSLLTIVPVNALYVDANYRETQLAHIRVGQPVKLAVDALPGVTVKGHVVSLAPASSVSFSPVAPHNATGNFTKITQRLPVRISIDPDQDVLKALRVGMSVHAVVQTNS